MTKKRLATRRVSFVVLMLLFGCSYLLLWSKGPNPSPKRLPDVCTNMIQEKQSFVHASKNGVQCEEESEAEPLWAGKGARPNNEYDVQEFLFRAKGTSTREVTVAVQLSMDRLSHLERLGNSWQGPVSACVYIPHTRKSVDGNAAISKLSAFHKSVIKEGRYGLDVGVVFALEGIEEIAANLTEHVEDQSITLEERYKHLYPVNVARNVALAQVRTDLTLLLDADFVFSKQARKAAMGGNPHWKKVICEIRRRASLGRGMFAVIPAFQAMKNVTAPVDKESVIFSYHQGVVGRMSAPVITHCQTNYEHWMESEHDYVIQYGQFFEPYGIAATELIPWFPEEFKGYRVNKLIVFFELAARGWDFVVLPDDFVVHLWHPKSKNKVAMLQSKTMSKYVERLSDEFIKKLANRHDTCAPEILIRAMESGTPVSDAAPTEHDDLGRVQRKKNFYEVPCANLTGLGKRKLVFPTQKSWFFPC